MSPLISTLYKQGSLSVSLATIPISWKFMGYESGSTWTAKQIQASTTCQLPIFWSLSFTCFIFLVLVHFVIRCKFLERSPKEQICLQTRPSNFSRPKSSHPETCSSHFAPFYEFCISKPHFPHTLHFLASLSVCPAHQASNPNRRGNFQHIVTDEEAEGRSSRSISH